MSAKKHDAFSEVIVGLFMLAVLSLLVYFTIVISGVDLIHGRRKVMARVTFADVGGLKDHDNVMYRGTKVGSVERIELTPTNLVVVIEVNGDVVLRDQYRIAVCNLSMLGGNYLLLEEGEGTPLPLETTAFVGERPTNWMRDVSQIAKNVNDFISGGELQAIVTNLHVASEKVRLVVERIERGEGFAGKLLSADDALYENLNATVADAKEVAARLKKGEGLAGRLLKDDDPIYANVHEAVTNFNAAVTGFRTMCDSLDATETFAGANTLLTNLNIVAERLKNGEGTIGRLLADDELYREVDGLTKDMRQVLDNFRDTTPISTFGSLIMGGL